MATPLFLREVIYLEKHEVLWFQGGVLEVGVSVLVGVVHDLVAAGSHQLAGKFDVLEVASKDGLTLLSLNEFDDFLHSLVDGEELGVHSRWVLSNVAFNTLNEPVVLPLPLDDFLDINLLISLLHFFHVFDFLRCQQVRQFLFLGFRQLIELFHVI